jgi:4a-hydroxytetrahydrobiopterin dehydratase
MWTIQDNKLYRNFIFSDFIEAFSFMTKVAFISEKIGHHPTFSNTYNTVEILLSTHDANNTITEKDYLLSKKIDELL